MAYQLKSLEEQVIVITGASSGIGLATAKAAIKSGASVILAARNGDALKAIVEPLQIGGKLVDYVVADVADEQHVAAIARKALERFGRIDTWVNVAGVDIWGKLIDLPEDDARRLFDTNFWGVVNGCKAAVRHMSRSGGALITVGSIAGDRGFPMQGMYCASKHAVKGFMDALRVELAADHLPISVTLIKPASIGTPLQRQAKNLMDRDPRLPPPVYAPEDVALAILHAAQHPMRDINVGFAGWAIAAIGTIAPSFGDWLARTQLISAQKSSRKTEGREDNLYEAGPGGGIVRDDPEGRTIRPSLFNRIQLLPPEIKTALAVGAVSLLAGAASSHPRSQWQRNGRRKRSLKRAFF